MMKYTLDCSQMLLWGQLWHSLKVKYSLKDLFWNSCYNISKVQLHTEQQTSSKTCWHVAVHWSCRELPLPMPVLTGREFSPHGNPQVHAQPALTPPQNSRVWPSGLQVWCKHAASTARTTSHAAKCEGMFCTIVSKIRKTFSQSYIPPLKVPGVKNNSCIA